MADPFHCSVVTPSDELCDEQVTYASIPAHDGQIGLEHGRAPLLVKLGMGPLRLEYAEGGTRWFFVDGGFAQMKDNKLSLLTTEAVPAEDIVKRDTEAALKEAQARKSTNLEEADRRTAEIERAKHLLSLVEKLGNKI